MTDFRKNIEALLQQSWQQRANPVDERVQAALVKSLLALLAPDAKNQRHGVLSELVSFGQLHRHVLVLFCPDQAFYPDAVRSYLQKHYNQPIEQQSIIFSRVDGLIRPAQAQGNELILALHLSASTVTAIESVCRDIAFVLAGVEKSVLDFPAECDDLHAITRALEEDEPIAAELLDWMLADHFVLFGLYYPKQPKKNKGIVKNKRLLAHLMPHAESLFDSPAKFKPAAPGLRWLHMPPLFSHIYSEENVEAVQIAWIENGQLQSVLVLGYFSRSARHSNASALPHFKGIWQNLLADPALQQSAFYKREIHMLFDRAPKSLLASVPIQQWLTPFKAIVDMSGITQVVTARLTPDVGNIEFLLIAVDKQRFGSNIWHHMKGALREMGFVRLGAEHFEVGGKHLILVAVQIDHWPQNSRLQQGIRQCVIFWKDLARFSLLQARLTQPVLHKALQQLLAIPSGYENNFPPEHFVADVQIREQLKKDGRTQVHVHLMQQALAADSHQRSVEIHVYTSADIPLGQMTDKLNAFALIAMEQTLVPFHDGDDLMFINRFRCLAPSQLHTEGLPRLAEGIKDVFNQEADHDPLNALLVLCGLNIHDVLVLIGLRNHLIQLLPEISKAALSDTMLKHTEVSRALFHMFEAKHRPAMPSTYAAQANADFEQAMKEVSSLNDDTWFRALAAIVWASLRCNGWSRATGEALAIKINTQRLGSAPYPKPYREIFVHGVFVEGVHLRAGPVARGGLRYSDRPTDFRTEVLELMATQVVKNGQIVPTGAKGGFVVRDGAGPDFVLAQYHHFVRALLSITDNLVQDDFVPPVGIQVAQEDTHDAYLVVAADKGTARYSDDANAESLAAGFWLGDAFASGGSEGYDHKAFGITARGAWECTAHHFARLSRNLWADDVTAVGIGDMGGDVFGNGMLLNPNLRLLAAFNHAHIFLDPTPDVAKAYAERQRLFAAVAGWGSYDVSLISAGGGVFARSAKSIPVSKEVRDVLGIADAALSGEALIRAILQAPVDVLYNGGIGTYIKASSETHADAQDHTNNAVRISAKFLRCKAISEGGNLGLTQASRIEYAKQGGMINTDAIDNAAGVNMSDHEVNLKILLSHLPKAQRNRWLRKAADAVAAQCLSDNKEQAIALSLAEMTAAQHGPRLHQLQQTLFDDGRLEVLEEDASLLTLRPVLAGWLGHEKNRVHAALDAEKFRSNSLFGDDMLSQYFPEILRKKFAAQIQAHALGHDIAHTRITSYLLNRYGLVSIHYLQRLTQASVSEVAQALLMTDTILATGQAYTETFAGVDGDVVAWYAVQQDVLNFAAGLLSMGGCMRMTASWLKNTTKAWAAYATEEHKSPQDMVALAPAIPLSEQLGKSLALCLTATELCLHVLPFTQLENVLRTPLWAGQYANELRRQWLQRLATLKLQATQQLLASSPVAAQSTAHAWELHPLQSEVMKLLQQHSSRDEAENPDVSRMRCLLAMTHLQNILSKSDEA